MTLTSIVVGAAVLLLVFLLLRSRGESQYSTDVDLDTATEEDMRALLIAGRKIDAIKVYRRLHRVDLKTAKEAVERLSAELPPMPRG
jgi:ribosomal protein L7/L12